MTERQRISEFDFNKFFNSSLDRLSEILTDIKEAQSEDDKSAREKTERLKELSDVLKKIDLNELSRDERKACKHLIKALDRVSNLYSRILDSFEDGVVSNREGLKLMFALIKDVFLATRDLNIAKKYVKDEKDLEIER